MNASVAVLCYKCTRRYLTGSGEFAKFKKGGGEREDGIACRSLVRGCESIIFMP